MKPWHHPPTNSLRKLAVGDESLFCFAGLWSLSAEIFQFSLLAVLELEGSVQGTLNHKSDGKNITTEHVGHSKSTAPQKIRQRKKKLRAQLKFSGN